MTKKFAIPGDYDLNDIATILQALDDYAKSPKAAAHVFRQDLLPAGAEGAGAAVTPRRIPALIEKLRRSAELATKEDRESTHARFEGRVAAKISAQPEPIMVLADQFDLDIDQTGGGCLAYARHYEDGWYWWLTADDGISLPGDPDEPSCQIGAYHPEQEWWLRSSATPLQALRVIDSFVNVAKARFAAGHQAAAAEFHDILSTALTSGYFAPEEAAAIAEILAERDLAQSEEKPQWQREFPRFERDWIPDLPDTFEDYSWHNDACPRFHDIMRDLVLWVDYPNPQDREIPENLRYAVCREGDDGSKEPLIAADAWTVVKDFIDNYTPPAGTAPNYNTLLMLAEDAKCKTDDDWGSDRQSAAETRFWNAAMARFPDQFADTNDDWQEAIHKATSDEIIEEAMRRIVKEVVRQNPNLASLLSQNN